MKTMITLALAAAALTAAPATAATYVFGYTFNTGQVVSGTFSGTPSGNLVTNISNVSLSIDGTPFTGPLFAYGFTGYNGPGGPNDIASSKFVLGAAQASTDPMLNNFFFSDSTNLPTPANNWFYIIPWTNGGNNQVATQAIVGATAYNAYNGQYVPGNWSLSAAVPEPATWGMLLAGFAMVGVAARRRKAAVAA